MFVGKVSTTGAKVATGFVVAGVGAGAVYLVDPDLFSGDDVAAENAMASVQRDQDQADASLGSVTRDEVYDALGEPLESDPFVLLHSFDLYDQDKSGAIETDEMKISRESVVEWFASRSIGWWDRFSSTSMEALEELKIQRGAEAGLEFDRLDTNHDNMLHIDEISDCWILEADWRAHDLNNDGHWNMREVLYQAVERDGWSVTVKTDAKALKLEEMEQMWKDSENPAASGPFNPSWFDECNHQGGDTLEQQEFASVEVQAWDELDANQDGKATVSERVLYNRRLETDTTTEEINEDIASWMLLDHFYDIQKPSETA